MTDVGSRIRDYPFGSDEGLDVDPLFVELLEDEPVSRIRLPYGGEGWLVVRYADVRQVMSDPRFSRALAAGPEVPRLTQHPASASSILLMDSPEHTRMRRLVAGAFTARRSERLKPLIERLAERLVDAMLDSGAPAELVGEYTLPLAIGVICELLGVPAADQASFRGWATVALSRGAYPPEQVREAMDNLSDYLVEQIDLRRREPADDLLGALVRARDDEDRLSELELVTISATLLTAGYENTGNTMANLVLRLLSRDGLWRELAAQPSPPPQRLATAIEELLRHAMFGTGTSFARIATEDVRIGGVTIRAGEAVFTSLPTANRDPRAFAEPQRLELGRDPNPHVTFGYGPHHCLGAQLARQELHTGLGVLLRRLPGLALAVPLAELPWKTGLIVRGVESLPVRW
jgi:nocardicin N-oxygenase